MPAHITFCRLGICCVSLIVQINRPVLAQGPLSIEQLIVSSSVWQLSSGIRFSSRQLDSGLHEDRRDGQLGLRYGVRSNLELNTQLRRSQSILRTSDTTTRVENSALDVGLNWQVFRESQFPALLLEYRVTAADTSGEFDQSLAAQDIALTAYKSLDPVVVSITLRHRINSAYTQRDRLIEPGDQFQLESLLNFAVNPEVTLLGGAVIERRDALAIDSETRVPRHDRIAMRGGVGIASGVKHTMFALGDIASDGSAAFNFTWLYRF